LQFVIGKLDFEMVFDAREQIQRLQAVDAELFEEIVVSRELLSRHFKMFGCEPQYFIGCAL
jgi:hypothetical protein